MKTIFFFKKNKTYFLNDFFPKLKLEKKLKIDNIQTLKKSKKFDLTFFDSIKYKDEAKNTKASYCITTKKLEKFLSNSVKTIIVKNSKRDLVSIIAAKIVPDKTPIITMIA